MSSQDDDDHDCAILSFKGFPGHQDWQEMLKIKFWVFAAVSEPTNRLNSIRELADAELNDLIGELK